MSMLSVLKGDFLMIFLVIIVDGTMKMLYIF